MNLKSAIRAAFKKSGFEIRKYPSIVDPNFIRARIFNHLEINLVLDVGANIGNYGAELREFGYRKRIASFEPVASLFDQLKQRAHGDSEWTVERLALGNTDGPAEINVADTMSSILGRAPDHDDGLELKSTVKQTIQVARLDSVRSRLLPTSSRV